VTVVHLWQRFSRTTRCLEALLLAHQLEQAMKADGGVAHDRKTSR
jgi:hypothetical protein